MVYNRNFNYNKRSHKDQRCVSLNSRHERKPPGAREPKDRQKFIFQANIEGLTDQPKVELYKLERNDNHQIIEWRSRLMNAYEVCRWTEENSLAILRVLVDSELYNELVAGKRILFKTAVEKIVKSYITPAFVEILKQRLYRVQYDRARNVREFAEYVKNLSKTIALGSAEKYTESQEYDFFKIGLPQNLRDMIFAHTTQTIQQAVDIISNYEQSQKRKALERQHSNRGQYYRDHPFREPHSRYSYNNRTYRSNHKNSGGQQYRHNNQTSSGDSNVNQIREDRDSSESNSKRFVYPGSATSISYMYNKCPRISINVSNKTVDALVDTGSPISVIRKGVLSDTIPIKRTSNKLTGVTDSSLKVIGTVTLPVEYSNISKSVELYIVDSIAEQCILGMNFMFQFGVVLKPFQTNTTQTNKTEESENAFEEIEQQMEEKIEINSLHDTKDPLLEIENIVQTAKEKNPDLGLVKDWEFTIQLTNNKPIQVTRPYKVPEILIDKTKAKIMEMLERKIIRRSNSFYAAPAFVKPKKNNDINLLIDYRGINAVTKIIPYPFPDIKSKFRGLRNATIFSTIDLNSGYYQIPIREQDKHLTAFLTEFGLFEFNRVPFGLSNPPKFFTRMMEDIFHDIDFVKVFIDDVLIYSSNIQEHAEHLRIVLDRILSKGLSINFNKSSFCKSSVKYLGCIIGNGAVAPDTTELEKLAKFIEVKTKKDLQKLLGYLNWHRQFSKSMSIKLASITDKLRTKKPIEWTQQDIDMVMEVKDEIKNTKLHFPDFTKEFELHTDASDRGCSGILTQGEKLIGLYSYKFNTTEEKYNIVEKEFMGIYKAIQEFKNLIFGYKVIVYTDNRNLTFIKEADKGRVARWKLALAEHNLEIRHIQGKDNIAADYISRVNMVELSIDTITEDSRIIVQEEEKVNKIIRYYHNFLIHPGIVKTCTFLRKLYNITNLEEKVSNIINTCEECLKNKKRTMKFGEVSGDLVYTRPFETIAVDIYGPVQWNGVQRYSLTIIDMCSRWVEFIPLKDITTEEVWSVLYTEWIRKYPLPRNVISDNGKQLASQYMRENLNKFNIVLSNICKYNPQSNSICERVHSTLGNCLRIKNGGSFKTSLAEAADSLRSTIHSSLKLSPMELLFGYSKDNTSVKLDKDKGLELAVETMKRKAELNNNRSNSGRKAIQYHKGDFVYVKREVRGSKLDPINDGPFRVIEVHRNSITVIRDNNIHDRVNIKRVTPSGRW